MIYLKYRVSKSSIIEFQYTVQPYPRRFASCIMLRARKRYVQLIWMNVWVYRLLEMGNCGVVFPLDVEGCRCRVGEAVRFIVVLQEAS